MCQNLFGSRYSLNPFQTRVLLYPASVSEVGNFLKVRKSQIRKFLCSLRYRKSANVYKILHNSDSKQS
jgi:hypothetical protein